MLAAGQETNDERAASPIIEAVASTADNGPLIEQVEKTGGDAPTAEDLVALSDFPESNGQKESEVHDPVAVDFPPLEPSSVSLIKHEPQKSLPTEGFYRFAPEERSQKIAALLLNGTNGTATEKSTILRDLVWRLVFEERFSLAFHVAQCLETHYPRGPITIAPVAFACRRAWAAPADSA